MNKMRLAYEAFDVAVEAERRDEIPQVFTSIRVHYTVLGQTLHLAKFLKAFELGAVKYCSVANMLKQVCALSYSFSINGKRYAYPVIEE